MKKRVGSYKGKPIVEGGGSNTLKKSEINIDNIEDNSTEDEYVYFCFPENTFKEHTGGGGIRISEQTEENKIILGILLYFSVISATYTTIRVYNSEQVRYMDSKMFKDNNIVYISYDSPLYIKINKNVEFKELSGSYEDIVNCYKGNYKNIISLIYDGQITGDELDQYIISKEEWDKAVEETYKSYNKIVQL